MRHTTSSVISLGLLALAGGFLFGVAPTEAAPITTENSLVVLRIGDGTTALSGSAAAVYLEEYSVNFNGQGVPVSATHVQTIPVNNVGAAGSVTKLTIGGTAALEGGMDLSQNGQYFMFGGYDSTVGQGASGSNNRRMVGRLDMNGVVSTDGIYGAGTTSANNAIRTVASIDGSQYWFGMSNAGIHYRTYEGGNNNAVNSVQLNTLNTRRLDVVGGQLYVGSASGAIQGVATVGTGAPTTAGQTVTALPGFPGAAGPSTVDYFFANANTLYVADDRTSTSGGLQKWVLSSGTWSLVYTKNIDTTNDTIDNGLRGITGGMVGTDGTVTLFGTTTYGTNGTANFLVGMTDTLSNTSAANVTVNSLASSASIPTASGALTTFRGVEAIGVLIPEPASFALLVVGIATLAGVRRRTA